MSLELQQLDLMDVLAQSKQFTLNSYLPQMAKGSFVEVADHQQIAEQVAKFSGLLLQAVLQNNLDIPTDYFWKGLLRDSSQTVGRLDSRYLGIDGKEAGA